MSLGIGSDVGGNDGEEMGIIDLFSTYCFFWLLWWMIDASDAYIFRVRV